MKKWSNASIFGGVLCYLLLGVIVGIMCYLTYLTTISYNVECVINNITTTCETIYGRNFKYYKIDYKFNVTLYDTLNSNIISSYTCSFIEDDKPPPCIENQCPHHFFRNQIYWCHRVSLSHGWYIDHHKNNMHDPNSTFVYIFLAILGICFLGPICFILILGISNCIEWLKNIKNHAEEEHTVLL